MAKIQTKTSHLRRFFGWFARHKITAVFTVLILAIILFFFVSWVVLQTQIHFERARFTSTNQELKVLSQDVFQKLGSPAAQEHIQKCTYTSVEIGPRARSCDISIYFTYSTQNMGGENQVVQDINQIIQKGYSIRVNPNPITNQGNISTYDININEKGISCFVDYWDITNHQTQFESSGFDLNVSTGLFVELACGGGAKADYFPVTTD